MKKTVKVIFRENEGKYLKGDVAELQLGYVRNYLIPNQKVYDYNDPNAKKIIATLKNERLEQQKEIEKTEKIAQELQDKEIIIKTKAAANGKLFGSVGVNEIAEKINLPKNKIKMSPIKEIGEHNIILNLDNNIKANIKIKVEKL